MRCEEVQQNIATALLTGDDLTPESAAHLALCPACSAEQASLRQVLAVMATVSAADVREPIAKPTDDRLRTRILQAAADEQAAEHKHRRMRTAVIGAAVAVFLILAGVAIGSAVFSPSPVITASASAPGLTATANISQDGHHSALQVSVTGLPYDTDCVITVHTASGEAIPIASWRAEYQGTAHVNGVADTDPGSITHVTLTEPDGHLLLDIPVET